MKKLLSVLFLVNLCALSFAEYLHYEVPNDYYVQLRPGDKYIYEEAKSERCGIFFIYKFDIRSFVNSQDDMFLNKFERDYQSDYIKVMEDIKNDNFNVKYLYLYNNYSDFKNVFQDDIYAGKTWFANNGLESSASPLGCFRALLVYGEYIYTVEFRPGFETEDIYKSLTKYIDYDPNGVFTNYKFKSDKLRDELINRINNCDVRLPPELFKYSLDWKNFTEALKFIY